MYFCLPEISLAKSPWLCIFHLHVLFSVLNENSILVLNSLQDIPMGDINRNIAVFLQNDKWTE